MITTKPVDATMWSDVEAVLGPQGGDEDCWCMGWRRKEHLPAAAAKAALKTAVEAGEINALIAYADDAPIGWCTFGPRHTFYHAQAHLKKATNLPDDTSWAIPCFFIKDTHRGQGVAQVLLQDALTHIRSQGATHAEAYPFDPAIQDEQSKQDGDSADDWAFTGSLRTFARHGFTPTQHCMNGCLHVALCRLV